jgi:hypothetical protein
MKRLLSVLLQLLLLAGTGAAAAEAPFRFSGPLPSLLPAGAKPAPVKSGLEFEIRLAEQGKRIEGTAFDLRPPGTQKSFRLELAGAAFAGGRLAAKARLTNGSGAPLEGLRLDLMAVNESYTVVENGRPAAKTRQQPVAAAALFFGDLAPGEASAELPFEAALKFAPETTGVTLRGVISGLRYEKLLVNPEGCSGGEIEADAGGNVYLADTCGERVAKLDQAGRASTLVKLPNQAKGVARNPAGGELAATLVNYAEFHRYGQAGGDPVATIGEAQGLEGWPNHLRFDPQGRLWAGAGAAIWRFDAAGRVAVKFTGPPSLPLESDPLFDVAADGRIALVQSGALWRLSADAKKNAFRLAGPGAGAAELGAPAAPRIGPGDTV